MPEQLDLFAQAAPVRYLGTGRLNEGLICEGMERYEYKGQQRMRGTIVAHWPTYDPYLLPIGGIGAGKGTEWKEYGG